MITHPITATAVLAGTAAGLCGNAMAGHPSVVLLLLVSGAAAGFANSGST
jgi:phosphoenolpyruvate-protein kinase (PTS system EI component)